MKVISVIHDEMCIRDRGYLMEQNKVQATTGITFRILVALSICHCLNDTLQSVISAVYPLFKEDLGLSFAQIGLITVSYTHLAIRRLTGNI